MSITETLVIALSLSTDAFAVALCKGLLLTRVTFKNSLIVGIWFGTFQCLMPLLGFSFGGIFTNKITPYNHIISFALLGIIGINMIKEALSKNQRAISPSLNFIPMLVMALATSVDALTVGVGMAFIERNDSLIYLSFLIIGATTFILSAIGLKIGNIFGTKYKTPSEILGGVTLIILAFKSLLGK